MQYLCLVYEEEAKVDALPEHESAAIADENRDYVGELQMSGRCVVSAGLQPAGSAVTVRVRNGSLLISDGPVVGTTERLGSFHLIDARDLNEAIQLAAKIPPARVGSIEVRPVRELSLNYP